MTLLKRRCIMLFMPQCGSKLPWLGWFSGTTWWDTAGCGVSKTGPRSQPSSSSWTRPCIWQPLKPSVFLRWWTYRSTTERRDCPRNRGDGSPTSSVIVSHPLTVLLLNVYLWIGLKFIIMHLEWFLSVKHWWYMNSRKSSYVSCLSIMHRWFILP